MANNKRSVSSSFWLQKRCSDQYFQQAQKKGLRSRAWFKLAEIQQSDKPFRPGMTVVDLGAAPGGWSQYVATQIGCNGRVIACDIIPMDPIIGVEFLMGDVRDPLLLQELIERIGNQKVQVLLSDMAPNMSGISAIDVPKSMHLVELALDICRDVLAPGGSFLVKVFQGNGFDEYLQLIRSRFKQAKIRKPNASRARSCEVYIIATGYK